MFFLTMESAVTTSIPSNTADPPRTIGSWRTMGDDREATRGDNLENRLLRVPGEILSGVLKSRATRCPRLTEARSRPGRDIPLPPLAGEGGPVGLPWSVRMRKSSPCREAAAATFSRDFRPSENVVWT